MDDFEKEISKAIENDEYSEDENSDEYNFLAKRAAENFLKKSERINIRISPHDLQYIKAIAAEEGMPYQTLVSSVLHKFIKTNYDNNLHNQ